MSQLTVFQAINQMRDLSAKGVPFSIVFMTWSETRQHTDGIKEVRRAQLKRRTKEADYFNADMIEEYIDLDTMEHRRFYHPGLMTFNGQKLQIHEHQD